MSQLSQLIQNKFSFLINDKRDLPFLIVCFQTLFILIPIIIALFLTHEPSYWWLLLYLPVFLFLLGPYLAILHYFSHKSFWSKDYRKLGNFFMTFFGVLYGLPPKGYFVHHIGMHHREENGPDDLSSTLKYDADNFLHWNIYFSKFLFFNFIDLSVYFYKKKQYKLMRYALGGHLFFFAMIALLALINFNAAMIVFVIPTIVCWFAMISGNWAQHAFIDNADTESPYTMSHSCIENDYNKICFNDGFHITHHIHPRMHWTEMPLDFEKNKDEYISRKAVVFRKLDWQKVWFLLMFKRYDVLAKYYVQREDESSQLSKDEIIAHLKSRTKRVRGLSSIKKQTT